MDRNQLLCWGQERVAKGLRMDSKVFSGKRKKLINQTFGGHLNFIEALGIYTEYRNGQYGKTTGTVLPQQQLYWTEERMLSWVKELYEKGKPIHFSAISKLDGGRDMHKRIKKTFGSHEQFIKQAGLPYSEICRPGNSEESRLNATSSVNASQLGIEFEELLSELFTEMGWDHTRNISKYKECKPDFIFVGNHWADAKISVNTKTRRMREKYWRYCRKLTIIHLVGSHNYRGILKDGTERISVFRLLNSCSENIQFKYTPLFIDIEDRYAETVAK